jgi:two-component system OmpR family response regulator
VRVLVVDDHPETRAFLVRTLGAAAHAVRSSATAAEAEFELTGSGHRFDAVVLDVMLPDESGLALCARLRSRSISVPILLLTARGDVGDRVRGLEAGADDYLPKPFAVSELVARLNALARRGPLTRDRTLSFGRLQIDLEARRVTVDGAPVLLTARELAILEFLASRRGGVVSRDQLVEGVWGEDTESARASLDVLVARIRRKLGAAAPSLQTVRGLGYALSTLP